MEEETKREIMFAVRNGILSGLDHVRNAPWAGGQGPIDFWYNRQNTGTGYYPPGVSAPPPAPGYAVAPYAAPPQVIYQQAPPAAGGGLLGGSGGGGLNLDAIMGFKMQLAMMSMVFGTDGSGGLLGGLGGGGGGGQTGIIAGLLSSQAAASAAASINATQVSDTPTEANFNATVAAMANGIATMGRQSMLGMALTGGGQNAMLALVALGSPIQYTANS